MSKNNNVVVIDVKKWCRGKEHDESTGKYCAWGFAQNQGVDVSVYAPDEIREIGTKYNFDIYESDVESAIFTVNDEMRGEKRRQALKDLFKLAGVKLKFKNLSKSQKLVKTVNKKRK